MSIKYLKLKTGKLSSQPSSQNGWKVVWGGQSWWLMDSGLPLHPIVANELSRITKELVSQHFVHIVPYWQSTNYPSSFLSQKKWRNLLPLLNLESSNKGSGQSDLRVFLKYGENIFRSQTQSARAWGNNNNHIKIEAWWLHYLKIVPSSLPRKYWS